MEEKKEDEAKGEATAAIKDSTTEKQEDKKAETKAEEKPASKSDEETKSEKKEEATKKSWKDITMSAPEEKKDATPNAEDTKPVSTSSNSSLSSLITTIGINSTNFNCIICRNQKVS